VILKSGVKRQLVCLENLGIAYKAQVLKTTNEENLRMIYESIYFLESKN
jgi:hypothetical protein